MPSVNPVAVGRVYRNTPARALQLFLRIVGIVVVPQTVEAEASQAAWDKVNAENITRDAIKGGMKATDAYRKYGVL